MFKSITFKLWLALSLTLILTLSGVFAITHYTLQQRFISHSFDVLKEQLGPLDDKIVAHYSVEQSLNAYKNNMRLWHRTIRISLYLARKIREFNTAEGSEGITSKSTERKSDFQNPGLHRAQKRFAKTLSLYTPDKNLIVGSGNLELEKAYLHPVEHEGQLIAYIAFEKPKYVLKESEHRYLKKQLQFMLFLSLTIILVTLVISAIISRWFLAPINKIRQSVSSVATGNYSARVDYKSEDELGVLVKNFNNMLQQLDEHESSRKRWVADISHEMRTPVAVLKAQIQAMLDGIRPLDQKNIELLQTKIDALGRLIEDLHELTMADIGALSLAPEKFNYAKFIGDFVEANNQRAENAGFTFTFINKLSEAVYVFADEGRIIQILSNIFENSLRYTTAPGQIRWCLQKEGAHCYLYAEDSGPTVPEDQLEKIFERLYRIERSRNKETGGSGLGLSLSRNLAHAHEGTLVAQQSELGGLKIILSLPISDPT